MKDKKARERAENANRRITDHLLEEKRNQGISIKDCPKCKHPVMALNVKGESLVAAADLNRGLAEYRIGDNIVTLEEFRKAENTHTYQCLTCGVKFTCSSKQVCEIIPD